MSETREPASAALIAKYAAAAAGVLVILWLMPMGCTDPAAAVDAAQDAGFKQVAAQGYRHFGCGWSHGPLKGYGYQTGFKALDPSGRPVVGVVCAGFGRAPYVRTYAPGTLAWRLKDL